MAYLTTEQGQVFVAERGDGQPPLLCIHGAGGNHQHWGFQLKAWSHLTRTLLLDLPGHGRSPAPSRHSIDDYGVVVLAVLAALELEQAVLVGHSMGGAIAQWVAIHAPQRVAGLVLVGTGARLRVMPSLLTGLADDPQATLAQIGTLVYAPQAPAALREAGNQAFYHTDPQIFRTDLLACDAFDVREQLGAINVPTLVICGEQDTTTPPKYSHFLHANLAQSELVLLPEIGHMTQIEAADAVITAVQTWFTCQYRSG